MRGSRAYAVFPSSRPPLFPCSLQATYIRNTVLHALRQSSRVALHALPANFVYDNPTIAALTAFILRLFSAGADGGADAEAAAAATARTLDALLDPLASPACNTHLVVMLLDCVLLALFPELGVGGAGSAGSGQGGQGGQDGGVHVSGQDEGAASGDGSGSGA